MNIAIRYYTKSGNTKKLADAISEIACIPALPVTEKLPSDTDVLFLCNSVYWGGVDSAVKTFLKNPCAKISCLVNVSTAALVESSYAQMKKLAEKEGITISDKEFHCKGAFAALHKGKPDSSDIEAVKAFAKEIIQGAE